MNASVTELDAAGLELDAAGIELDTAETELDAVGTDLDAAETESDAAPGAVVAGGRVGMTVPVRSDDCAVLLDVGDCGLVPVESCR